VKILTRAIALSFLALAVAGGSVAPPAGADGGPVAVSAKAKKKCKKKKKKKKKRKGAASAAKAKKGKKKCKRRRSSGAGEATLPGLPTHPTATPPAPAPAPVVLLVSNLGLVDNPILAGTGTQGLVTLSSAAPSGGQPVELASSDPSRVSVPASVHVAAGQTVAGFPISTTAGPTVSPSIAASIGTSSKNAQLTVVEEPSVKSVTLSYKCYPGVGLVNFGANRVSLDVPAPADTSVGLLSSDPTSLAVPSSVIVPSGASSAFFGVDTLQKTASAMVTASLGTSSASDTASVRDGTSPAPVITGLSLNPTTVLTGQSSTGTVTLDCEALAGGSLVTLSSDNPQVTVPATVTVAEDQLTATFQVLTTGAANGLAEITGTLGGSQQATLTINDLGT
jgi:hypothetical protein